MVVSMTYKDERRAYIDSHYFLDSFVVRPFAILLVFPLPHVRRHCIIMERRRRHGWFVFVVQLINKGHSQLLRRLETHQNTQMCHLQECRTGCRGWKDIEGILNDAQHNHSNGEGKCRGDP